MQATDSVGSVLAQLLEADVRQLPVVDRGMLVGAIPVVELGSLKRGRQAMGNSCSHGGSERTEGGARGMSFALEWRHALAPPLV